MQNIESVKALEAMQNLYKNIPNLFLFKKLFLFLLFDDLLVKVSVVKKLHDDAT